MDVTELAHWRYRITALQIHLQDTEKWRGYLFYPEVRESLGETPHSESYQERVAMWEKAIEANNRLYQHQSWLLEEAKYMKELGEIQLKLKEVEDGVSTS